MSKMKELYIEIIESLKNENGVVYGKLNEVEQYILDKYNDDQMVQYKYGKLWHSVDPAPGNKVCLLNNTRVRIIKYAPLWI